MKIALHQHKVIQVSKNGKKWSVNTRLPCGCTFIEIWEASQDKTLHYARETGNSFDPFAVAVSRDGEIIGYTSKLISAARSLFLDTVDQLSHRKPTVYQSSNPRQT